ncbi:biosynthetic arginine decarboxylase [Psychrosphaera saromensis]|uniref:Biosynthetic arginine decarboxylase n=1 Tax=Psychrosphaera saromensis TaxID=716813 RepID=A0A2S7URC4_9GAMM|nr:biosynthetic arginine decarboxylase [Psychrosphaera saromensis]PQJ52544.1 arginine decarboxylase [Psychrosphaera saromensis]GHB69320.1 biosynthetic arginine decarboxylase [Psychrosphaera saromensis]GLQ13009.1 biosynthetic arginine decarboxylase [Psychrosphaera saromensis]
MNKNTLENVRACYNVRHWSQGYFGINDSGNVYVAPKVESPEHTVDLSTIAKMIQDRGLTLPALVRFPQIIHHRVHSLCDAFNNAIKSYDYQEKYLLVYPIKVNQQREVVDEILASQYNQENKQLGLEAGSKAELLAVLALAHKASSVIVCNGYKDKEYVRLALIGEKLGHQVHIVLEKMSELEMILSEAKKLGVKPRLGIRVRLASQGKGKWQASGGEKSKFGLSASQVLHVVQVLKNINMLDALVLVHFHLGSQMANIRDVRLGVSEAARFYCELRKLGAGITCMDVGGGLAIDYDGTRSQSHNSMNYSLAEYANNIVYTIGDTCKTYKEPMPMIISESGRALTAHHAVLISNVIGAESYQPEVLPEPEVVAPLLLKNMWNSWLQLSQRNDDRALIEIYHDTQSDIAEVHTQFGMGLLNLPQRAWAEQVNLRVCYELHQLMDAKNRFHRPIIDGLTEKLADKFFVNFSLFQSLPDSWGIDQVFPVLPLTNLERSHEKRAVLLDITCDSDGTIGSYVDGQGIETTLPVPAWKEGEEYLLGFFLVGAYQEILGDMHNLFGDTHSAVILLDDDGEVDIKEINEGDSVADMLSYVHLDVDVFTEAYEDLVNTKLPEDQRAPILEELVAGLRGYTYLEDF